MNLYLVQHGQARPKEEDPQRSLSNTSRSEAENVAAYAARYANITVVNILHSGKTRAEQTAEVFAKHLKPTGGISAAEDLEPMAEPSIWVTRLAKMKEDVMLIGHMPHLCKLASLLLCGDADRNVVAFQNAGIVCLNRDGNGTWVVRWLVTPDIVVQR